MKGYEIIKKIANKELNEGTRIQDDYNVYILKYDALGTELTLFKEDDNEVPDYSFFADNDNEFEILEEDQTIKELELVNEGERKIKGITGQEYTMRVIDCIFADKINELVKEINKLKEN